MPTTEYDLIILGSGRSAGSHPCRRGQNIHTGSGWSKGSAIALKVRSNFFRNKSVVVFGGASAIPLHEHKNIIKIPGRDKVEAVELDDGSQIQVAGVFSKLGAKGALKKAVPPVWKRWPLSKD